MGLLSEGFTVLAIIEARDKASEIYEHCGAVIRKFGGDVAEASGTVKAAADEIDESLASTASGADPLELAAARVSAAEDQVTASTTALAAAQQRLLAVSGNVAPEEALGAAAEDVAAAQQAAAGAAGEQTAALAAQREALTAVIAENEEAAAATGLMVDANGKLRDSSGQFASAAQVQQGAQDALNVSQDAGAASAGTLAEANAKVADSNKLVADTATEAAAAQARQDALVTSGDVATAAQNLTKAEKDAASASKGLSAARSQEAATQRAVAAADKDAVAATEAQAAAQKEAEANSKALSGALSGVGKVAAVGALGLGVAGALMVKSAGDFQDSTAHLQTDAGVTAGNLGMIRANILNVSTATGQSASSITDAMYHIASSGFTGANSLGILKAAAEGARVGGADLDTTSKALVGTMTAYYGTSLTAAQATRDSTSLMNQLIQAVGSGDMRMQDLASSLSTVTPVAAAAGISFAQVGGAVATMTAQGMTARQATQDLANTIRNLKSPNNVASTEMRALGLNANDVSKNLGKTGLAGTLSELRNAVLSNTSGGSVMLGYLKEMSPAAQSLANQVMAGSISTGALTTAVKGLNPEQARLVTMFKTAATSATGLKQTYTGAMSKMLGGATGLNTALMLTGKHMGDLTKNTAAIAAKAKDASGNVDNWSTIQGTFNFKVAQAKTGIENTGIAIGSALLPAVSAVLSAITKVIIPVAEWTAKHKTLTEVLFVGVTALAATVAILVVVGKTFKAVSNGIGEVKKAYNGAVAVLQKLAGKSKETADTQKTQAAETATVEEEKSAEAAAAQEADAGEVAVANAEAAAESQGSWATSAAGMIGNAVKWVAQSAVKVASVVAANVGGALVTAGAWMAANAVMLLGIGLVVIAVVAAVLLIVKYWKTITAAVSKVWDDVFDYSKKIIGAVVSFIKSHWALIVGIFLGPIALVVALVVQHWKLIEHYFQDGVHAVEKALAWFIGLPERFHAWLAGAASAVTSEGAKIIGWFTSLPGRVVSEVGKLASMLFGSGEHVIESLANGITSAASGALHGAMSFVTNTIKSFLPFSPAKQGPLSGSGDPSNSGRSIAKNLAKGLTAGTGDVAAASHQLASSVAFGRGGSLTAGIGSTLALSATAAAGSGGGPMTVNIDLRGSTVANDASMNALAAKVGNAVVRQLPGAGYKIRTV